MSFWQIVYLCVIGGASVSALAFRARESALLVAVLWFNFIATMFFAHDFRSVAILDIACAAVLAFGNVRAQSVAFIFTLMIPVYFLAFYGEWTNATTYAIIDVMAYCQCAILGWPWNSGTRRINPGWFLRGGHAHPWRSLAARLASFRYPRVD